MSKEKSIALFNQKTIRIKWDSGKELWYFSVVDVIAVLTDSIDPVSYWRKLKQRLNEVGNETLKNRHGLKMVTNDGKLRVTDCFSTQDLLRIIQSIPSPKIVLAITTTC